MQPMDVVFTWFVRLGELEADVVPEGSGTPRADWPRLKEGHVGLVIRLIRSLDLREEFVIMEMLVDARKGKSS